MIIDYMRVIIFMQNYINAFGLSKQMSEKLVIQTQMVECNFIKC